MIIVLGVGVDLGLVRSCLVEFDLIGYNLVFREVVSMLMNKDFWRVRSFFGKDITIICCFFILFRLGF